MVMLADFNQPIISNYSPISARGGKKRHHKLSRRRTRRQKKTNTKSKNGRTRRRYR